MSNFFKSIGKPLMAIFLLFGAMQFSTETRALDFNYCSAAPTDRHDYYTVLLKLSLDKAEGEHTIQNVRINEKPRLRRRNDFSKGVGDCNILWFKTLFFEENIGLRVPFPLTGGLEGYRRLVIPSARSAFFNTIASSDTFKAKVTVGDKPPRLSARILKDNGFSVVSAANDSFFRMLKAGRFDTFHMPLSHNQSLPDMDAAVMMEPKFILNFNDDSFFYVQHGDQARHNILLEGLMKAFSDGSLQALISRNKIHQIGLKLLKDPDMQIINLENRFMSEDIKSIPNRYWFMQQHHN